MVELTRTMRFGIEADGSLRSDAPRANTYAAWPALRGLGRYYELHLTCRGEPDPITGYFLNITEMDRAARASALPTLAEVAAENDPPLGALLQRMTNALRGPLHGSLHRITLQLTPTYGLAMETNDMNSVLLSQRFSFSAAHRLHVDSLSAEQNREVFGKCNNPAGHGHNYELRVTVASPVGQSGRILLLDEMEQIVQQTVIERFDHKHLNLDTEEFEHLNPSVENIAIVIYELLAPAFDPMGAQLDEVTVWETAKTSCTYRGE